MTIVKHLMRISKMTTIRFRKLKRDPECTYSAEQLVNYGNKPRQV